MGRRSRLEYPGLVFHVFTRGVRRSAIYRDEEDYEQHLADLEELSADCDMKVLGFTLMPNHPHLGLLVGSVPLCVFMQRLNLRHALRFNRKYGTFGHVFEARYDALPVDRERYLFNLVRYIHLNPVRAQMVANPSDWPYSSHRAYLGEGFPWVHVDEVLRRANGPEGYRQLMSPALDRSECDLFEGRDFRRAPPDCADLGLVKWRPLQCGPWSRKPPVTPIEAAASQLARQLGFDLKDLRERGRTAKLCEGRRSLAALLQAKGYRLTEIGRMIGRDEVTVSRILGGGSRGRPSRASKPAQLAPLSGLRSAG